MSHKELLIKAGNKLKNYIMRNISPTTSSTPMKIAKASEKATVTIYSKVSQNSEPEKCHSISENIENDDQPAKTSCSSELRSNHQTKAFILVSAEPCEKPVIGYTKSGEYVKSYNN